MKLDDLILWNFIKGEGKNHEKGNLLFPCILLVLCTGAIVGCSDSGSGNGDIDSGTDADSDTDSDTDSDSDTDTDSDTETGNDTGTETESERPEDTDYSDFTNLVIWEDLADDEVIRVGDIFYYTASTMHYSPGAPVLRSYDLVNWEYVGHSVPVLDFDNSYDLNGRRSYVNGIWASSLQYRESKETFYWMGCMHNVGGGYVFTAKNVAGPWEKHKSQGCYTDTKDALFYPRVS